MFPGAPDRWDIEWVNAERVRSVAAFGLTERQARFLVTVMLHSGVFMGRQYCAFAGITHGQKVHDFLEKLLARRYATATAFGPRRRTRLFHVHHKPLYAAIGEPDNRNRKVVSLGRAIERLMILDGVLADRALTWLGTERDKRSYFVRRVGDRVEPHEYPRLVFGKAPNTTIRYFPDKLPIGIEPYGWRHVFLYLATNPMPMDFRLFLLRHAERLHAVSRWTVRILFPGQLATVMALFKGAGYEQLASPLHPAAIEELRWLFRQRRSPSHDHPGLDDERLMTATKAFRAPRFRALYRRWLENGDPALWLAQSPVFRDALERDEAQVECVVLPYAYAHLSSLIATA
ncbi:MAG: hypothetical protein GEV06_22130 [Luteitalea sp.]|nr:hypothetical protein [Luteitalea sp.]